MLVSDDGPTYRVAHMEACDGHATLLRLSPMVFGRMLGERLRIEISEDCQ